MALAALVLAVASSGLFQWLIEVLQLGRVIKFIHLPVLVGITNGSAIALTWMALKDVLGIPALNALGSLLYHGSLSGAVLGTGLVRHSEPDASRGFGTGRHQFD